MLLLELFRLPFVILSEIFELEEVQEALSVLVSGRVGKSGSLLQLLPLLLGLSDVVFSTQSIKERLLIQPTNPMVFLLLLLVRQLLVNESLYVIDVVEQLLLFRSLVPQLLVLLHELELNWIDQVFRLFLLLVLNFHVLLVDNDVLLHHIQDFEPLLLFLLPLSLLVEFEQAHLFLHNLLVLCDL